VENALDSLTIKEVAEVLRCSRTHALNVIQARAQGTKFLGRSFARLGRVNQQGVGIRRVRNGLGVPDRSFEIVLNDLMIEKKSRASSLGGGLHILRVHRRPCRNGRTSWRGGSGHLGFLEAADAYGRRYARRLLATSPDGVGTEVAMAQRLRRYGTISLATAIAPASVVQLLQLI